MTNLTLDAARIILDTALAHARANSFQAMAIVILDARGVLKAALAEDGVPMGRVELARGKANGAVQMGVGTRTMRKRMIEMPHFMNHAAPLLGGLVPNPGGVLIRGPDGSIIGAAGASGDTGDNDEMALMIGIEAAGLTGDPGSD